MKNFTEMTLEELEKWEKETNSLVLINDEKSIAFQKIKDSDSERALVIMIDSESDPVILVNAQIEKLQEFLKP